MTDVVAVTVVGRDRPGIVAGVTEALFRLGCNVEDATSTILRGHFAMMLIVRPPEEVDAASIEDALRPVSSRLDLVTSARPVAEAEAQVPQATHTVSVYGSDRPGIVFRVAQLLAARSVNITDLQSRLIGPEDEAVYALLMEVVAPPDVDVEGELRALAAELGVDVTVNSMSADLL